MTVKPTLFIVTDVETCRPQRGDKGGHVFDVAWSIIDRKGREYGNGYYLAEDILSRYTPFFKEKMGLYFRKSFDNLITPASYAHIAREFNIQAGDLIASGYRVLFCAYNARFDATALSFTAKLSGLEKFLEHKMQILCIWENWGASCPLAYTAPFTASGKYLSTSAESVYAFEFNQPDFVEEHTGRADVVAEAAILRKVLRRKKPLLIHDTPATLPAQVWKTTNERIATKGGKMPL